MFGSYRGFHYSTDKQLMLRQASALGDFSMVKLMVQSGIDINAKGSGTKRSALHQACLKGHTDIAIFLVEQGADISTMDNESKTPITYCNGNGNRSLGRTLALVADAKKASDIARQIFPIEGSTITQEQSQKKHEYRERVGLKYQGLINDYRLAQSKVTPYSVSHRDIALCDQYVRFLIEVDAYLTLALKETYEIGSCGERTRAAFAYLANRFKDLYHDDIILEMFRIEQGHHRNNHAFLVINRPLGSDSYKPGTWGNAIVCDPYVGEVYLAKNASPVSAIAELSKATNVLFYSSGYQSLNPHTPKPTADFYASRIKDLVQRNRETIQSMLPTIIESKNEPDTHQHVTESHASCSHGL